MQEISSKSVAEKGHYKLSYRWKCDQIGMGVMCIAIHLLRAQGSVKAASSRCADRAQ